MALPFISIIIPARDNNPYLEECISHCKNLDYSPYEIMILPDNPLPTNWEDVKVVPSGLVGPSSLPSLWVSALVGGTVIQVFFTPNTS